MEMEMKTKMKKKIFMLMVVGLAFAASTDGQTTNPGFISIDCGASDNYLDGDLDIDYKTDAGYVSTGEDRPVSSEVIRENYQQQSKNMRIFPNGTRNCYTLTPDQGKGNTYLIRTTFWYGNYDGKNETPAFDLYIDVNYWSTVNSSAYVYEEIIYVAPRDDIQVCLVNTGFGTPFISSIELRPLDNSTYRVSSGAQVTMWRYNIGGSPGTVRHPQDEYDRLWLARNYSTWPQIESKTTVNFTDNNDAYKVPQEVLTTAARSANNSFTLILSWTPTSPTQEWYMYFHFAEFQVLLPNQTRQFGVYVVDQLVTTVTPEFGKPVTVASRPASAATEMNFTISPTTKSNLPAILNAVEIMYGIDLSNPMTALDDVNAMKDIKNTYQVTRDSWQGDPCSPRNFSWDGLNCSNDSTPRIVSLNLRSSNLTGNITSSLKNLTELTSLDLSNNQLTGQIPDFLAEMTNLKVLNLTGNDLSGSIPEALKERQTAGTLQASFDGNPGLCVSNGCGNSTSPSPSPSKKKNNVVVPVVAASVSVVVIIVLVVLAIVWRNKRRRIVGYTAPVPTGFSDGQMGVMRSQTVFTSSDISTMTDNFRTVIGEGGFGKVYLGALKDGTKVAVKMPSKASSQGFKEFQAEAQLLMIVHHRNLVSLVGYCDKAESMALIYEYMGNGNLRQHLSEHNPNVLSWSQRLQIAVDAAQGLEYLHNGCKPPIIHRDLKTPNILLNESMQAKIADFGLSKAFSNDNESHISTRPAGTPGYLDPEFHASGNLTKKSDVFSFGVILFELITGHPAIIRSQEGSMHILAWVTPRIESGDIQSIVDPRLNGQFKSSSAWKAVEIAMSCVPTSSHQRPDMNRVLLDLKECLGAEIASGRSQGFMGGSMNGRISSFEMTSVGLDLAPNAR